MSNCWPPALRAILRNILDEPIPDAVKRRFLKPLFPRPFPLVRKSRGAKPKVLLAEFDLLLFKKDRGGPPPFLVHREFANHLLRDFRPVVRLGHRLEGDVLAFLSAIEQNIEAHVNEELMRQLWLKYSEALTIELE